MYSLGRPSFVSQAPAALATSVSSPGGFSDGARTRSVRISTTSSAATCSATCCARSLDIATRYPRGLRRRVPASSWHHDGMPLPMDVRNWRDDGRFMTVGDDRIFVLDT